MTDSIKLVHVKGYSRNAGVDDHGNVWLEFTVDFQQTGFDTVCGFCNKTIRDGQLGWLRLDDGEVACFAHLELK